MRFLVIPLIFLLLISCVEERDLSQNTVVVRISYSPDGLHPTNVNSSTVSFITEYTQKSLIGTNLETEEDFPELLKRLPQPDSSGLIYSYELKEGVFWDDGSALSVEDIIFTVKVVLCPLTNNSQVRPIYTSVIDSVYKDTSNPNKFFLKCKNIHILNKDIIGDLNILQESFWDSSGVVKGIGFKDLANNQFESNDEIDEWFNQYNSSDNSYQPSRLVGLGAYKVTKFEKDNYIILEKKANWWGANFEGGAFKAYPQKIIFKVISDNSSVYLGIKNQKIDVTQSAGGISKLIRLRRLDYFNENYHSEFVEGYSYSYMGMNMRPDGVTHLPLFTDVKVRRAIAHLVPVEEIIEVMYYGKAMRQASIVSPLKPSCDTTLKFIDFDTEKAKKLLKEAGWEDTDGDNIVDKKINGVQVPFEFRLNYVSGGNSKEIVLMMKESMKRAGVALNPNPMDFNSLYKNAGDHTFDAMLGGWLAGSGYSDPTQLWSTESWSNKGANFCGFGNPKSDSLIVATNTSLNKEEHLKSYKALQRMIYEAQPYVFLWSAMSPMAIHKRFNNANFYRARPNVNLGELMLEE